MLASASMDADGIAPQATQGLPATLAGATRSADPLRWVDDPGRSIASSVTIYRRGNAEIQAVIVKTLSPVAKLPRWQLPATPSGPWRDMQTRRETRCDPHGCAAYSRLVLQGSQLSQRRSMEAAYCSAGVMTDSLLRLRAVHAWNRLSGRADSQVSVVLVVDGDALSASEAAAALGALCGIGQPASAKAATSTPWRS